MFHHALVQQLGCAAFDHCKGCFEDYVLTIDGEYPDHKGRVIYALRGDTLIQRVAIDKDGKVFKPMIEGTWRRT